MNLTISGHHLEITPAIRDYVAAKLDRVKRHFDHVINVTTILRVDKLVHKVEASLHVKGHDFHAHSEDGNMYAAIDLLADKLDRPNGFSHKTILPACAAAIAISACELFGVQMSIASISGRAINVRQSVSMDSYCHCSANARVCSSLRPQMALRTGRCFSSGKKSLTRL